jgi:hypothetical protein
MLSGIANRDSCSLKIANAAGESFVYQQLRALCPDFDATKAGSPRARMEVKSPANERGSPFEISFNEWEAARRCHQDPDPS